ncbi:MAG: hypothetical protein ACWGO1_14470 [Anaerolineales bacterium]
MRKFNRLLDWLSQYLADRKGLLPILGILLVGLNFVLQFISSGWLADSNLLLHLGVILAILGVLLAWAL